MASSRLFRRLRARLRELRNANGANVTVIFALATVPIVGFVGAAVDYSLAHSVRTAMQAAADSTALMLSKEIGSLTEAQVQTKAGEYFKALFNRPEATGVAVNVTFTTTPSSKIKLNVTSSVKTDFMGVMGVSAIKLGVESQVQWGNARLRVALALDVTGSMASDGKMDALKIATKGLLGQLKGAASKNGDVYVSIVPFNKDVNVGKSNHDQNWVKWSGQSDTFEENNGDCSNYTGWSKPKTKSSCLAKSGTWKPASHSTWNGCVTDRDQDYDTTNTAPNVGNQATLFPAEQYSSCPTQLLALTYDWTALEAKVDALTPKGSTNQTIGLQWAFQALTAAPFTVPPKDSNYKYSEVIILMTDGLNTQNRFSSNQSAIDVRMSKACSNAKGAGIVIYAVQVNTGGDPTQSVLKTCASDPSKFFELKKANQLIATFNSIGTALSNLRIAE